MEPMDLFPIPCLILLRTGGGAGLVEGQDWWRGRTGGGAGLVSNPILQVETLQFRVSMAYPKSHVDK
jgi:hypothetical protein